MQSCKKISEWTFFKAINCNFRIVFMVAFFSKYIEIEQAFFLAQKKLEKIDIWGPIIYFIEYRSHSI